MLPFVKQEMINDCGYACLAMIINYYQKINLTISELKLANNSVHKQGDLSIYELSSLARQYNVELSSFHVEEDRFYALEIKQPIILYLVDKKMNLFHYVIVYKRRAGKFLVADSSRNDIEWINIEQLMNRYTGIVIFTKKIEQFKFESQKIANLFYLLNDIKGWIIFVIFLALALNIIAIISKSFIKVYLDQLNKKIDSNLIFIFVVFLIVFTLKMLVHFLTNLLVQIIEKKLQVKLWDLYINKLNNFNYEQFHIVDQSNWFKRLEDLNIIIDYLISMYCYSIIKALMFLAASITIIYLNATFLLIFLIASCFYLCISLLLQQINKVLYYQYYEKTIVLQFKLLEYFNSFLARKSKNINEFYTFEMKQQYQKLTVFSHNLSVFNQISNIISEAINYLTQLVIFYLSFNLIIKDHLQIGDLMFMLSLGGFFLEFISWLVSILVNKNKYQQSFKQVKFIWEKNNNQDQRISVNETITNLQVCELVYEINGEELLSKFNYDFNKSVLITGKSGSGKTTLLMLLANHLTSFKGEIKINSKFNINDVKEIDIMRKIFYLPANDYLFATSIYNNLTFFKNSINLQLLNIPIVNTILQKHRIELLSEVNSSRTNLSKGQQQIISFLAMLNAEVDVYLLDECLSNVDKKTKISLLELLFTLKKNKLIIYASHDSLLENYFDNILDLEKVNSYV